MCMKYNIPKNVRILGVVLLVLIAVYIGLTIFVNTREGLSDGANTANVALVKATKTNETNATAVMGKLPASTNAYMDLIVSYKNLKMVNGINELVTTKVTTNLTSISDYNEAIDYLSNLSSTASSVPEDAINTVISANDAATKTVLDKLPADNQAYIDLIESYKKLKLANAITDTAAGKATLLVTDCDHAIDYLNELSGATMDAPKPTNQLDVPTTPDISLRGMSGSPGGGVKV